MRWSQIVDLLLIDQFEHAQIWILRAAVIEPTAPSATEINSDIIHPASEPEEFIPVPKIKVQRQDLQMFEKNAPVTVHDRLGHTCRSR
jgi:hypothetical protein